MSAHTENTRTYWMMFLLSLVATIAFLVILPEWFWVTLPFLFTAFVKAMKWI
jgi:hypothetical protein